MRNPFVSAVVAAMLALACSSRGSDAQPSSQLDASPDGPVEQYDAKGCLVPYYGVQPGAACITSLKGRVVDSDGKPIVELITTACGDGCTFGKTDPTGLTSMVVRRYMRKAAMMLHGRSKYASYYTAIAGEGDIDKGTMVLPKMPADGVVVPEDGVATTITSGDVKLLLPAGLKVEIDKLELADPEEQKYRSLSVPLDKAPPFADPALKIVAVYAMTPFATGLEPGVGASVQNRAGLAAGAAVEFFVHGTNLKDMNGPFAGFTKLAEGHVSADGKTIDTDPGQYIPELTWLGIRLKP